jgi:hypothetical protein
MGGEKDSPMGIRIDSLLAKSKWLALPAACFFLAFSAPPAAQRIITFQDGSAEVPESAKVLVGHWRKTTTPGRTGHHTQLEHHRESRDHP